MKYGEETILICLHKTKEASDADNDVGQTNKKEQLVEPLAMSIEV